MNNNLPVAVLDTFVTRYFRPQSLSSVSSMVHTVSIAFVTGPRDVPRTLKCPPDQRISVEVGESEIPVFWDIPRVIIATNGSDFRLHSTHRSGDLFPVGITTVSYSFVESTNQSVVCDFVVTVVQGKFDNSLLAPGISYGLME